MEAQRVRKGWMSSIICDVFEVQMHPLYGACPHLVKPLS